MAEASDPLAGTPFRVISLMAATETARVFEVEHLALGTRYVAKVIDTASELDVEVLDRMRLEAQTVSRLGHANVARLIAFDTLPSGAVYLVMERLVGATLRQELTSRGAFPELEAIGYVRKLLAVLKVAHRERVAHRDIRLENLFVHDLPKGTRTLKVLDFGLRQPNARFAEKPTDFDVRMDILASALVLYELVTGQNPLLDAPRGARIGAMPYELDLSQVRIAELARVLERALSPSPSERFQSAEAFDEALSEIVELENRDVLLPRVVLASAAATFVLLGALALVWRGLS